MLNREMSQSIYRELMAGKVINRDSYDDGQMKPNLLFEEVLNNFDDGYRALYLNIGSDLVMRDGFIYVRSLDAEDSYTDAVRKIHAVLLVLARGVTLMGYQFDILMQDQAGLKNELIEQIDSTDEARDVMAACGMKADTLLTAVKNVLETRAIAYRNGRGSLVLSNAGRAFFTDLFEHSEADWVAMGNYES